MVQDKQTAEVVIIGGGVIGLAIARELAARGVNDVVVLERSEFGSESSWAAAGMLAPQAEANVADDFFHLACRGRDMYELFAVELLSETGIDVELDKTGTLYVAFSDHDVKELEERFVWQNEAQLAVRRLAPADVLAMEPQVNGSLRLALEFPLDGQVENRKLLSALIAANNKLGVRLEAGTTVESIRIENDKVVGVQSSAGTISTRTVVIAAGAWSSLIASSPYKALPDIGIKPVRGQMVCYQPEKMPAKHVIYSARGYVVPRQDGRVLAGSTSEPVGFDKGVTASGMAGISSAAVEILPDFSSLPIVDSWAGLRPATADALPAIGPCAEIDGVYYACGHFRNGILLAPVTADIVARAIIDRHFPASLEVFSPDRFRLVPVS